MSFDRNLTISLGFPLTRFPRHPEEPHLHIRLSDGFRQVRRQQEIHASSAVRMAECPMDFELL